MPKCHIHSEVDLLSLPEPYNNTYDPVTQVTCDIIIHYCPLCRPDIRENSECNSDNLDAVNLLTNILLRE